MSQSEIRSLSLAAVRMRLAREEGWPASRISMAVTNYKKFLILALGRDGASLMTNPDADMVWHYHILDSRAYMADCDRIFGSYLHHIPPTMDGKTRCSCDKIIASAADTLSSRPISMLAN